MSDKCQMIIPHHPDCECATCREHRDQECGKVAVGTVEGDVRVCVDCAREQEAEEFTVAYDADEIERQEQERERRKSDLAEHNRMIDEPCRPDDPEHT